MHLHGFDLNLLQKLDGFQTNQRLVSCLTLFSNVWYPKYFSFSESVHSLFNSVQELNEVQNSVVDALNSQSNLLVV